MEQIKATRHLGCAPRDGRPWKDNTFPSDTTSSSGTPAASSLCVRGESASCLSHASLFHLAPTRTPPVSTRPWFILFKAPVSVCHWSFVIYILLGSLLRCESISQTCFTLCVLEDQRGRRLPRLLSLYQKQKEWSRHQVFNPFSKGH